MKTSKWFVVATEGATADGRTIERRWIEEMAANYDPSVYGARVNLEHFKGILPDGGFKRLGDVLALTTKSVTASYVYWRRLRRPMIWWQWCRQNKKFTPIDIR